MDQGLIHVYCGDGKGKTTAAVGLAVRAAGRGKKVVFLQFMKGADSGEIHILKNLPGVTVLRNERDLGFYWNMTEDDMEAARQMQDDNFGAALSMAEQGICDMLVLDEATYAYEYGLIDRGRMEKLVLEKPAGLELVLTGQKPAALFLDHGDYITEMKKIRHPFDRRVKAREGIEY